MINNTEHENKIQEILERSYRLFKTGGFSEALQEIYTAHSINYDHHEVLYALKAAEYWNDRIDRINQFQQNYEKGEYLFHEWIRFSQKWNAIREKSKLLEAIRQYLFDQALNFFLKASDGPEGMDPELLLQIGRSYKGKGNYEKAVEYLDASFKQRREDAKIIAEIADCYSLLNETKASKMFFREAFLIDAQRIEIWFFESEMILRLIERVAALGYQDNSLKEWLPVYGVLYGVFNVRRELKPIELEKLKLSIYSLQTLYKEKGEDQSVIIPRLINRYFWLIDQFIIKRREQSEINEILFNIKELDYAVYEQYIQ